MRRFGWRLLFVIGFIPVGLPVIMWTFGVIVAASVTWLLKGADVRDGRDRLDRWLRAGRVLDKPLDVLMRKADVLRELWT